MKQGTNQYKIQPTSKAVLLGTVIGSPIILLLILLSVSWRFKKPLYFTGLYLGLLFFLFTNFTMFTTAPKAAHAIDMPYSSPKPLTEHEQIIAYIKEIFGAQAPNAFKILSCENAHLLPEATGHNTNGTTDTGIFQVNSIWGNPVILKDWKTNIDVAYQIYLRGGWNEWACEYKYHVLDK